MTQYQQFNNPSQDMIRQGHRQNSAVQVERAVACPLHSFVSSLLASTLPKITLLESTLHCDDRWVKGAQLILRALLMDLRNKYRFWLLGLF